MNMPEINMIFTKRPSGIGGVVTGLWNRRNVKKNARRKNKGRIRKISASINNIRPALAHIRAFNEICNVENTQWLHPLYPVTYVYPLVVRVLGHKKSSFDIFKSLNIRSWIKQIRKIGIHETMNVLCSIKDLRTVAKGIEIDVGAEIIIDGLTAWECCYTFFCRGRSGEPSEQAPENKFRDISEAGVTREWYLEQGIGFRFAKISGDSNGIHYWDTYARMLGFRSAFAQPLVVVARSLETLQLRGMESLKIEQQLKGPVYYNNRIFVKGDFPSSDDGRFDIYCGENPKPCICCRIGKDL